MNIWLIIQLPIAVLSVGVWYVFVGMSQHLEKNAKLWNWLVLIAVYYLTAMVDMNGDTTWSWAIFMLGHLWILSLIFVVTARKIVETVLAVTMIRLVTSGLAYLTMQFFWSGDETVQVMYGTVESLYFLVVLAVVLILWQKYLERREAGKRELYRDVLEEKHNEVQLWMHDMKNHLSCIYGLLEIKDYEGALNYVQGMDEKLQAAAVQKFTDHPIVNILLTDKKRQAEEESMEFEYYTDGVALNFAQSTDICAILGNLLDNALEGGRSSMDKMVSVDIYENGAQEVIIQVVNSCDQPPVMKNQQLQSTKHDGKAHGFGLKSVRQAAERYDGELQTDYDAQEKTFRATVILRPHSAAADADTLAQPLEVDN